MFYGQQLGFPAAPMTPRKLFWNFLNIDSTIYRSILNPRGAIQHEPGLWIEQWVAKLGELCAVL